MRDITSAIATIPLTSLRGALIHTQVPLDYNCSKASSPLVLSFHGDPSTPPHPPSLSLPSPPPSPRLPSLVVVSSIGVDVAAAAAGVVVIHGQCCVGVAVVVVTSSRMVEGVVVVVVGQWVSLSLISLTNLSN